ncbi:MAG: sensor histidine kinase [Longimicrobiales bacterium]
MTLRSRLFLSFAGITVLVLAPALFALSRLAEVRNIAFAQRGTHAVAREALGQLRTSLAELDRFQRSYVAANDPVLRQSMRVALAAAQQQVEHLRASGYADAARPAVGALADLAEATAHTERLVAEDRLADATAYLAEMKPLYDRADVSINAISEAIDARSYEEVARAEQISSAATTAALLIGAISLILALAVAAWTTGALSGPIDRLRKSMVQVAGGEFVIPGDLPYERTDEIGDLARSFRTMTEKLAELQRLRAEFVSIASHELKTPINVLGGYAELMADSAYGELTEQQRDVLRRMREQTLALTGQVNQLLDISRIEAGGFHMHAGEVELAEVLESVRRMFEPLAEQKRIRLETVISPSVPATIVGDADRLRNELLGNLISNAFKFTPEAGRIAVSADADRESLHLTIADSGAGIPPADLPHIFEKFYQAGSEARAKGSGLGLAIAKEVVERHGGSIRVESELGRGTTFHVLLPLDGRQPAGDAAEL